VAEHLPGKAALQQNAISEFKEFAAPSLYLYICIGVVVLFKSATLQQVAVDYAI
jgi:hypothetical protein